MFVPAIRYGAPPMRNSVPVRRTKEPPRLRAANPEQARSADVPTSKSRRSSMTTPLDVAPRSQSVSAISRDEDSPGVKRSVEADPDYGPCDRRDVRQRKAGLQTAAGHARVAVPPRRQCAWL